MLTFLQKNVLLLLLAGVFAVVAVSYFVVSTNHESEVVTQEQEIAELDAQMETELATARAEQQAVVDDVLGTNGARIEDDTVLIREFLQTVTTWETGEEYEAARESVIRRYALDEESQFMQVYFQEPVYNTDSSGNRYYVVDTQGLNSALSSIDVLPLGVTGTEYRYMVLTDISSTSDDGEANASKTSVIYLTLDGEGTFSDVSGFASVSTPLTSN